MGSSRMGSGCAHMLSPCYGGDCVWRGLVPAAREGNVTKDDFLVNKIEIHFQINILCARVGSPQNTRALRFNQSL